MFSIVLCQLPVVPGLPLAPPLLIIVNYELPDATDAAGGRMGTEFNDENVRSVWQG